MRWQRWVIVGVLVAFAVAVSGTFAQNRQGGRQDEKPEPKEVVFSTSDGVRIGGVYYPSKLGKDAAPVMLLHMFGRNYFDWRPLINTLREADFAILIFDFRGHQFSTQYDRSLVPPQVAERRPLTIKQFRTARQLRQMIQDVEAAKKFLLTRHNAGELNIARLCIVGAEFGATVGTLWAQYDWSFPPEGYIKMGQDAKALVLLSPVLNYRGLNIAPAVRQLQLALPFMIAYGMRDPKAKQQAERIWRLIRPTTPGGRLSQLVPLDTKLQGTFLLDPELRFNLDKRITQFLLRIQRELVIEWEPRGDREKD